jgi:hypothetical protein
MSTVTTATAVASGTRARVASPVLVLGVLVGVSFAVRLWAVLAHATPRYFPDEYIYPSLAKALSEGHLTIRGQAVSFPALLEPLVTAPAWLAGDVEIAYRLTQGLHALLASLLAVPAYLLARRVGLTAGQALACAALTLAMPGLVYAAYLTADVLALLLGLAAAAAGTAALARPTGRAQLLFLSFAGLATFARVQYVVLPVAFAVAAGVVSGGRVRRLWGAYRITLVACAGVAIAVLATGPSRVLGYYDDVLGLDVRGGAVVRWAGTDLFLLTYAAGLVLVPFALVGLAWGVARSRTRAELGFTAFAGAILGGLLVEAVVYAASGSERFQERYLLLGATLVPPLAFLGLARMRERGARNTAVAVAGGLLAATLAFPLSSFTVGIGKQDSPFLHAVARLEDLAGVGGASAIVAVTGGVCCVAAALVAIRGRGAHAVIALALGLAVAAAGLATSYDVIRAGWARKAYLGSAHDWVDRANVGTVGMLVTPNTVRAAASEQLFWNHSATTLLQLPGAPEVDAFGSLATHIADTGVLVADGRPWRDAVLVQEHAARAELDGARLVTREANTSLWQPVGGTPRVAVLTTGYFPDGWLADRTTVSVWPRGDEPREGTLRIAFALPDGVPPDDLTLTAPDLERTVRVAPGRPARLTIDVHASRPWTLVIRGSRPLLSVGRLVSVQGAPPTFVERKHEG